MEQLAIGSTWHKWDMHIHTPYTKINNQYKEKGTDEIWKTYCEKLNDSGIDAFGITDYGSFENYLNLKRNRNSYGLKSYIFIFPNLELRVSGLTPKKREDKDSYHSKVNIHILFSNNVEDKELETLLSRIYVKGPSGRNLDFLNNFSEIVRNDRFKYVPGYDIVLEALKSVFGINSNKYLIMVPNNDDGIATGTGTGDHDDFTFVNDNVDIIQSSNENDRKFYLKLRNKDKNPYDKIFPCVTGSDAHDFSKFDEFKANKVTWIKSDLSFEGLRSILFEPESRVIVQKETPQNKLLSKQIKKIELPEKDFKNQKVFFNRNLVSIIGSRSSGKSLLLSILAKNMGYNGRIKENNESYEKLVNFYNDGATTFYYDEKQAMTNIDNVDLIYQNQLQSIAMDQKKTNNFVDDILLGQNLAEKINLDEKLKIRASNLKEIFEKLKNTESKLDELNQQLGKYQKKEKIKENISRLRQRLESLETDYDKEKATSIEEAIKNQRTKKIGLENENNSIKDLPERVLNDIPVEYIDPSFNAAVKEAIDKFKSNIKKLIENQTKKNIEKIKNIDTEIESLKENSDYKKFQDFKGKTPQLNKIDSDIKNEKLNLSEREKLENEVNSEKSNVNSLCTQMHDLLTSGNDTVKILENDELKFEYRLKFNFNEIKDLFVNDFKTSSRSYKDIAHGMLRDLEEESKNLSDQVNDFYSTICNILNMDDKIDPFRKGKDIYILLNDLMAVELLKYDYSIFYNNKDFKQMSEGKKAFVLLLLKLKIENNDMPLLIDQPEDELDNRSIVNDLVELLRKQKEYRQIILVTHNANIVIGADSEQVIIASERDGADPQKEKFYYEGGSLENTEIRSKICEILEGGKNAFKKRENRYNFKDLQKEVLKSLVPCQ